MKREMLLFLLLFITIRTNGQDIHTIRFIHRGEELKPIGTLLICVGKLIQPTDRTFDETFGKSVKTDMRTFESIKKFIKTNKLTTHDPKELKGDSEFYEIKDSNGLQLYLGGQSIHQFFGDLRLFLKKKDLDQTVIEAFKNY
jgi:hypothetical protein